MKTVTNGRGSNLHLVLALMHRSGSRQPCCVPPGVVVVWAGLLWRVLFALLVTPVMGQATAIATSSSTFFAALTDPKVSLIQIPPDNFALIPEQW